mmetsp:Transcript_4238/g.13559  ORF Transcript_4238/g.13559 Transcript_4238/m.13559 type:complete len:263 (-) Transcript_4238:17-805(-)
MPKSELRYATCPTMPSHSPRYRHANGAAPIMPRSCARAPAVLANVPRPTSAINARRLVCSNPAVTAPVPIGLIFTSTAIASRSTSRGYRSTDATMPLTTAAAACATTKRNWFCVGSGRMNTQFTTQRCSGATASTCAGPVQSAEATDKLLPRNRPTHPSVAITWRAYVVVTPSNAKPSPVRATNRLRSRPTAVSSAAKSSGRGSRSARPCRTSSPCDCTSNRTRSIGATAVLWSAAVTPVAAISKTPTDAVSPSFASVIFTQ